ncbi:hypothetical protein Emed_002879 [Eimeria media]
MAPQLLEGFEEDDLLTWAHHNDLTTVPDAMLLKAIEAANVETPEADHHGTGCPSGDKDSDQSHGEQDGRHSAAKKANRGENQSVNSLQRTGGLVPSPSPVPARVDLLPDGSEVAKLADVAEPSADEMGAAVNVSSQVSASDGDSEDETSSDPAEFESSDTSGSDSD